MNMKLNYKTWMGTLLFLGTLFLGAPAAFSQVWIGIQIGAPPPPRVVAVRPVCPGPQSEYVWVEGYWYPASDHYYWHRGYWTRPPYEGARWIGPRHDGGRYYGGYWDGPHGHLEHNHHWDHDRDRDRDRWRDHEDHRDHDRHDRDDHNHHDRD